MARRSKGFSELLNQQQAKRIQQEGMEELRQKVQKTPLGDQVNVVMNPSGTAKMSEVLEEFVDPYLAFAETRKQRQKLFEIAVLAWNLALISKDERQQMLDKAIEEGITQNDPLARQNTREILTEMIERKERLFPDNQRCIVEFQLQDAGENFRLLVASTPVTQPSEVQ
jgi:hypothetical protein